MLRKKGYRKRNEPCHCGSGIKYKKCCMDKDVEFLKSCNCNCGFCFKPMRESEAYGFLRIEYEGKDVETSICSKECLIASRIACHNDVDDIHQFLKDEYGYTDDEIKLGMDTFENKKVEG